MLSGCASRTVIQTPHLASGLLAQAIRRLRVDWPARHGVPLWLVETFVETERFSGTFARNTPWFNISRRFRRCVRT